MVIFMQKYTTFIYISCFNFDFEPALLYITVLQIQVYPKKNAPGGFEATESSKKWFPIDSENIFKFGWHPTQ